MLPADPDGLGRALPVAGEGERMSPLDAPARRVVGRRLKRLEDPRLLPVVVDAQDALAEGAPLVHPERGSNVVIAQTVEAGDVDAQFAAAAHTLAVCVSHARVAALPIETRGGIGAYDPSSEQYTLWL